MILHNYILSNNEYRRIHPLVHFKHEILVWMDLMLVFRTSNILNSINSFLCIEFQLIILSCLMQISNIWSFRQLFNICWSKYKINLRGLVLLTNSQQCSTNGNRPKKLKSIYYSFTERKTVSNTI